MIQQRRAELDAIRKQARERFRGGATGVQVAAMFSEAMDGFVVGLLESEWNEFSSDQQSQLQEHTALVAVGGTGRG
ncbi:MAG: hypothetical protein KDA84_28755, partial [Planctomycetaceae bacterium]|nr:hypothetical protein [Planctomycetaceae bacterium]